MKQKVSAKEIAQLLVRFTVGDPPHRETIMSSLSGLSDKQVVKIRDEIMFLDIVVFGNLMGSAKVKRHWEGSSDVFLEYSAELINTLVSKGHDYVVLANTVGARERAYKKAIGKPLEEARFAVASRFEALCGFKDELSVNVAGMGEFVSAVNHVGELLTRYEIEGDTTNSSPLPATTDRVRVPEKTVPEAAEAGDASAQFKFGEMYRRGEGVPQDDAEAFRWYRKAAEQGNADAQYSLGLRYHNGRGVTQDYAEAVRWFREAAEQGDAKAQAHLGFMFERGLGTPQDDTKAIHYYRIAAEQGYAYAQYNLGILYRLGQGVQKDDYEAFRWYLKAAQQGWPGAQFRLGQMYEEGRSVDEDKREAVRWYRKAAEQGDAGAQAKIDALQKGDQGVPAEDGAVLPGCSQAAKDGDEDTQLSLSFMDDEGRGVLQDDSETLRSCREAAEQGEAQAQLNLARMYEEGRGVPLDEAEALRWYYKAAEQGDARAEVRIRAMDAKRRLPQPKITQVRLPALYPSAVANQERPESGIAEKIKNVRNWLVGVLALAIITALTVVLVFGMTWVSMKVLPWLMPTFFGTLAVCLLLLGPTALFRRTRGFSAIGLMIASHVFGAILWIWSFLLTLSLWGTVAVVIGLLFAGVGIIPMAVLAAIFHAQWSSLGDMAIMLVATFGLRAIAIWLVTKADRDNKEVYFE